MMSDLGRFIDAQAPIYDRALAELRRGRKQSHWMWFVFPQIAGLGTSPTAHHYALASPAEAGDYLAHPILGPRLRECTSAVLDHVSTPAERIFGDVDAMKFRSSMTLFETFGSSVDRFGEALDLFYDGRRDLRTLAILKSLNARQ